MHLSTLENLRHTYLAWRKDKGNLCWCLHDNSFRESGTLSSETFLCWAMLSAVKLYYEGWPTNGRLPHRGISQWDWGSRLCRHDWVRSIGYNKRTLGIWILEIGWDSGTGGWTLRWWQTRTPRRGFEVLLRQRPTSTLTHIFPSGDTSGDDPR